MLRYESFAVICHYVSLEFTVRVLVTKISTFRCVHYTWGIFFPREPVSVPKPLYVYEKWRDLVTKLCSIMQRRRIQSAPHQRRPDTYMYIYMYILYILASEISISIFSKIGSACASMVRIAAKISGRPLANTREHSRIAYSWNKMRERTGRGVALRNDEKKVKNSCIFRAATRLSFRRVEARRAFCIRACVLEPSSRLTRGNAVSQLRTYLCELILTRFSVKLIL